jgi:hypothetical protein
MFAGGLDEMFASASRFTASRVNPSDPKESPMSKLFAAVSVPLLVFGNGSAIGGRTENEAGSLICQIDKWNENQPEKVRKLVDYAGRCMIVPNDPTAPKVTEECTGQFEYMPDETWKANGTCIDTYPSGDKKYLTWEEGSHLNKEFTYEVTGGTGKYQGVKGNGTYRYENLTDTVYGGPIIGKLELP